MKQFLFMTLSLVLVISFSSCSRKFTRDYEVVDASEKDIPLWVENYQKWLEKLSKEEKQKSRFSVYASEPKTNRTIACKIAEVRAREKIAAEISALIKNSFLNTIEGDPSDTQEQLSDYVTDELVQEIQAQFVGSRLEKTYWEKQRFSKKLGAKENWDGFICHALVMISQDDLAKSFDRAHRSLDKKAKGIQNKEKVKVAIEEARSQFIN
jgi:hypothetical protein